MWMRVSRRVYECKPLVAGGDDDDDDDVPQQPFGSPTPSPGGKRGGGKSRGRALFPPEGFEGGDVMEEDEEDEDAMGMLDGLLMLADATTLADADRKRKRKPKVRLCRSTPCCPQVDPMLSPG